MATTILIALAPVAILVFYTYHRDKYDKEPIGWLITALFLGGIIAVPVIFVENILSELGTGLQGLYGSAFSAFVVASFTEESFKLFAFAMVFVFNKKFNELFDGIVYATFISLGFAAVENVMYVMEHGNQVGLLRGITAVPAHALFGITMGFYYSSGRFYPSERRKAYPLCFLMPFLLHGVYDFILFSEKNMLLLLFIPFMIYLWYISLKKMKLHSESSIFKPVPNTDK